MSHDFAEFVELDCLESISDDLIEREIPVPLVISNRIAELLPIRRDVSNDVFHIPPVVTPPRKPAGEQARR